MDLQRQKKLREGFLIALWELHAGNYGGDVSTREVCKKIGINYDTEGSTIGQYLYKRGLVVWSSFEWISLTTDGIVEAERLVEEREKEKAHLGSAEGATVACPKCNYLVRENARFCENCGISLSKFAATTVDQTVKQPATIGGNDPLIGRELDGKYRVLARLGQGGVGTVYRAERLSIGDDVAIKVLHQDFGSDPAFITRFQREARAPAIARHRNIVHIYDFVAAHDDSPAYIVMEYVRGRSLRTVLERDGRLELNRAVSLMREICAAVGAAHHVSISHRDLKPANIIIAEPSPDTMSEEVKVIGIAKLHNLPAEEGVTEVGTVLGTPQYMSPEQCKGEAADARSDVYSLGVMLYEMLSGMPPFTGTNLEVTAKHMRDNPLPLPRQLRIPPAVERAVIRALAKDADARQPDALALSRDVAVALENSAGVEAAASLGEPPTLRYEIPRPTSAIGGFYDLQDTDVTVLKRSCEIAIERGYLKHIDVRSLLKHVHSLGITREQLFDSLEVLTDEYYIEPSKTVGGGLPINDFEITEFGFEQYANEYVPDYQGIVNRVVTEIIQDNKDVYDKPDLLVEHVLDHLAGQGFLKLSKRLGGKIVIMHVSAQMRRQHKNTGHVTDPPKTKHFNEVASQIGSELRFRSKRDEWFFSDKGQASAKELIVSLHHHLRELAKEITERDSDVLVGVESDAQGFLVLRCRGISLTSSWNPGLFANSLKGSVLRKKILDGYVTSDPNIAYFDDEKPKELRSTDYGIDMSVDGRIGWRNLNQQDDRVFSSEEIAESWITDLMNEVQRKVSEQESIRTRN